MMNQYYVPSLVAAKKSENTIKNYTRYIEKALKYIGKPDNEVTYLDLVNYQSTLNDLSNNSVRIQISALKSYFSFLTKAGIINANPAAELEKPKSNPKEKHYMTDKDINAMIDNCRTDRDVAIIKFMVSTGVRISELINITLDEYHDAMSSDRMITILGKGAKERNIYIAESVQNAIDKYLASRNDDCPYLFTSIQTNQLDAESFSKTLKNTARKAGIPYWKDISNHCMRTAFATIANQRGVDIQTISKAMGHSSISVTSVYIRTTQTNINNAMSVMAF